MKNIRFSLLILACIGSYNLSISQSSFGGGGASTDINSDGDGDWETAGSWDTSVLPDDGDVINILAGETITVTTNNITCDESPATTLNIYGTLTFTNGAKLNLGCGSRINVMDGGLIDGGSGGGSSKKIYICGNEEWNSGDPDVVGPYVFGKVDDGSGGTSTDQSHLDGGFTTTTGSKTGAGTAATDPNVVHVDDEFTDGEGSTKVLWAASAGQNISHFEIYKSQNGLSYEWIDRIEVGGELAEDFEFEFIDDETFDGTSYYKIEVTDGDGETKDYGVASHVKEESISDGDCVLTVYPNPCPGSCRAKLSDCPKGTPDMRLMMTDATGRVVNETYQTRDFNGGFDVQIDKSNNLKPGIYIISGVSGEEKFSEKVIVK